LDGFDVEAYCYKRTCPLLVYDTLYIAKVKLEIYGVQYPLHDVEIVKADEVIVPEQGYAELIDVTVIHKEAVVKIFKLDV
jgi:hypothetical protein